RPRLTSSSATGPPAPLDQATQRPAPVSDPGTTLKDRPPPQFCRHKTGSSVGNPKRRRRESNPCTGLCRPLPKPLGHSATEVPRPATATAVGGRPAMEPENRGLVPDGVRRLRADDGIRTRDPHLGKVMLYQLSHVRVPARW